MAVTNEQIIETEKALRGIEEECHTFARWKEMGYTVKKGEKAAFAAAIWKYREKNTDDDEKKSGYCFLKKAHFFRESQVEPIEQESLTA